MRLAMSSPFQKALKLPATIPERIVSDDPPSRDAVTISWTCLECELVKTLVNSGMSTAARVPQLMMDASCHHRLGRKYGCPITSRMLPSLSSRTWARDRSCSKSQLMKNEVDMHRIEAIQIRRVSGCSKSNSRRSAYWRSEIAWLM